jgi:N4-gp56 family major capsid protein
MAKTIFSTSNTLTKKAYDEKLYRDVVKMAYFSKFMGEGPENLVQVKSQLEKGKGDRITIGLRKRLTGAGVTSGQTLEGNEESLTTYSDNVTLEQYRHAVRSEGAMDEQRAVFEITDEQEQAIKDWGAEKIDQLCFDAITTSPTKVLYLDNSGNFAGTGALATAKAALHATNSKITPNFISAIKAWALTGGNRAQVPLRPLKVEGGNYLVLLVHPDVRFDLQANSNFQNAMQYAQERGMNNPLFKSAIGIWDNVVIHAHENIPIAADGGGASVAWSQGVLMGAQSLAWAWGTRPTTVKETFDYGDENGVAFKFIAGVKKLAFNSQDFGAIGIALSRTNVSGV